MSASYPQGGYVAILCQGCVWSDRGQNSRFVTSPVNSHSYLNPKIPFECHHGVVRCVGRCHLHLFPVFTSAIDSCAPIFIKPLFHSFPPVICLLSPHIQLPPAFSHFPPPLHSCLFPHISFQPGSTQVQKHNPRFSVSLKCIPSSSECKVLYKLYGSAILFLCFFGLFCPKWVRFGSFPLAVAVSIWWAVGRKVEAPSRSSFLLSLQIATKA